MTKTGTIAVAFGVLALIVTILAVDARGMSSPRFVTSAYGVTTLILVAYTWSLARRLANSQREKAPPGE